MIEPPTFEEIVRRWELPEEVGEIERYRVSMASALTAGDDPLHIISYLAGLGHLVTTLEQMAAAIEAVDGEEELSIEWSADGLVVRHASDGWLALFTS